MVKKILCCGIETSSLIVGWIGLIIMSIIGFLMSATVFHWYGEEHIPHILTISYEYDYLLLFITLFMVIGKVLLIYGIKKKRRFLLLPWLICMGGIFPCFTGWSLVMLAANIHFIPLIGIGIFIAFIAIGGFLVYLWYGVYSLYQKMKRDEKPERRVELIISEDSPYAVNILETSNT